MKGLKIGLIAALSVIVIALCSLLAWGMGHRDAWRSFAADKEYAQMRLVLEKEVSLDGVDGIDIWYDMNSNDVYFYEAEGDTLLVKEYANYEAGEGEISTVGVNGSLLEIRGKRRSARTVHMFGFGYNSGYGYTEIWLPASYKNALTVKTASGDILLELDIALDADFSASSSSGDMTLKEVSAAGVALSASSGDINGAVLCAAEGAGRIKISTSSGDVQLREITGNTTIETTSGYISVDAVSGTFESSSSSGDITVGRADGDTRASATSGYIKIEGGSGKRDISTSSGDVLLEEAQELFEVRTTSGEVIIKADKGSGSISTSSGDVRLTLSELTGELDIHTTSGGVWLSLAADTALDFEANTTSGDIDTFFDDSLDFSKKGNRAKGTVGSAPLQKVDIETSSGDVRITKL